MSQQPKVSVIIPVYNTEPYLRQCLDSVTQQTMREIEIILVDDGSTDASLSILREYEEKDGRVTVLTQPNINAGAARNNGLKQAKGEYLSFLDADDFFAPDMLEKAYLKAKEQNAQICVFHCDSYNDESGEYEENRAVFDENLPAATSFSGTEVKNGLFHTFVGWAWDKLFLREFITENGIRFQEQRTTNDLYFTYFALAKAARITVIEEVLAHHRIHVKASLEATRAKSWDCFYKALLALKNGLTDAGLFRTYERDFVNYTLKFSLWNLWTISWPIREKVYYLLKLIWFDELSATGRDRDYFYSEEEYTQFQKVMNEPYLDEDPYLLKERAGAAERRIADQENRIADQERRLADQENRIADQERRIADQENHIAQQNNRIAELENRVGEKEHQLLKVTSSLSFKIGRALTWLPRKVRGALRRLKKLGQKQ